MPANLMCGTVLEEKYQNFMMINWGHSCYSSQLPCLLLIRTFSHYQLQNLTLFDLQFGLSKIKAETEERKYAF